MKFGKKQILPVLLVALLFTIGTTTGTTMAKYVTEREISSQVTFTAKLAEKMVLEEHEAFRQSGGDYKLNTREFTKANDYVMMPGVDLDKNPYIQISKKTPIKSYLFLEVVGHQPGVETNGVRYTLKDEWKRVDDLTGKHSGSVYVYYSDGAPAKLDEKLTENVNFKNIFIIKDGKVYVSQHLNKSAEKFQIKFYAVMGETASGTTPEAVYQAAVNHAALNPPAEEP